MSSVRLEQGDGERLVEARGYQGLGPGGQLVGRIGQVGIRQLCVNIIRLLQNVSSRCQHRFRFNSQGVRRRPQHIFEKEIIIGRERSVLAKKVLYACFAERENFR